ncbi:hypothetical protein CSN73_004446 [Salmonella enterica subsp. diarizonae]|nr:hypothetical protein [Salmonella enterica subsp. diarizonae]
MKGLMKHLVLTALAVMLCSASLPASASQDVSHCVVDSGSKTIPMQNIILPAGKQMTGEIYQTSKTIGYTCLAVSSAGGNNLRPTLFPGNDLGNSNQKGSLIELLNGAGLGLTLEINEAGLPPKTVSWEQLKGGKWSVGFGKALPFPARPEPDGCTLTKSGDCQYTRSATIKLTLYVAEKYPESSTVTNMPAKTDVLRIMSSDNGDPYITGYTGTSGFAIKILQKDLTTVSDIYPKMVDLGHFIKADEASLTRSGKFTVTVTQKNLPAPGQTFDLPLNITFGNGSLQLLSDKKHLALRNTGDTEDNGLQLAIKDVNPESKNANQLIPFNQETCMGTLTITSGTATGKYTGHYAIEVSKRPDKEVRTGSFTGGIPVTITYN